MILHYFWFNLTDLKLFLSFLKVTTSFFTWDCEQNWELFALKVTITAFSTKTNVKMVPHKKIFKLYHFCLHSLVGDNCESFGLHSTSILFETDRSKVYAQSLSLLRIWFYDNKCRVFHKLLLWLNYSRTLWCYFLLGIFFIFMLFPLISEDNQFLCRTSGWLLSWVTVTTRWSESFRAWWKTSINTAMWRWRELSG